MQKGCHVLCGKMSQEWNELREYRKLEPYVTRRKVRIFLERVTGFATAREMGIPVYSLELKGKVTLTDISVFQLYSLTHCVYCRSLPIIIPVLFTLYYGSKICGTQSTELGGAASREARWSVNMSVFGKLRLAKSVYMKNCLYEETSAVRLFMEENQAKFIQGQVLRSEV